ncbi:MAG: hypothetical protein CFE32_05205 [Alphaproteobacteria bacterium PA3]|nr:MAG: hypothetical protein CFE32_05205 [Alphaproteobacteria bacterium PA3]
MGGKVQPRRVLHIFDVPEVLPSGMPIAIFNQVSQQIELGHAVYTVNYWPKGGAHQTLSGFLALVPGTPSIVRSMRALLKEVRALSENVDDIYIHGLWTRSALCALFLPRLIRAKIRHAPHGALDNAALQFGYLKKRVTWYVAQKWALERAGAVIATSRREMEGIQKHLPQANTQLIPLQLPNIAAVPNPNGPRKRLLYFGRIHPIKGIAAILNAWKALHADMPDWDLALIGPQEEPWSSQFRKMAEDLDLPRVTFQQEVMPNERLLVLATANLVLAPSLTENFGLVIAEALALGRTVIASKQTGWHEQPRLILFSNQIEFQKAILSEAHRQSQDSENARAIL